MIAALLVIAAVLLVIYLLRQQKLMGRLSATVGGDDPFARGRQDHTSRRLAHLLRAAEGDQGVLEGTHGGG